jgi:UDP-N-acetyl-D-mannosaminuronic acid transferase (WecB/TagA/CpsF family)
VTDGKKKKIKSDYSQSMWQIWGISLFGGSTGQVLKIIEDWQKTGKKKQWIATVNPEFVMAAQKDPEFKKMLEKTNLNVVDGVGYEGWARNFMWKTSGKLGAGGGVDEKNDRNGGRKGIFGIFFGWLGK